jgi:hypothetical protein
MRCTIPTHASEQIQPSMVRFMAFEAEKEISGLELLRQPATPALAQYLNDLRSTLEFQAFLWSMVVGCEYGQKVATNLPKPGDPSHKEGSVAQMETHSIVLEEMVFCRGVNSFLTYLADLMTLIYGKYPKKLPADKQTTYGYCIDHHLAGDLVTALAEQTVMELTHQRPDALAKYFKKNLDLGLFTKDADSTNAALCVDIRNVITHNRGIINRFFIQRNPRFANDIGKRVVLGEHERFEMLGGLGYCARQLDIRAIKKFGLETIEPKFKESANASSPNETA